MIWRFGEFELDEGLSELRQGGAPVEVQPKALDLLLYLARHRDRVVAKRELLEQVWPGVVVSEGALTTAVNLARAVVNDGGAAQRVIRTVPRRGYRFVAEIGEPASAGLAPSEGFIGREDALARLWSAFQRARAGAGGVALLAGEAGIGKTRTAAELSRAARAAGARVLSGACYEGEGAPAYWPWVQVLRGFAPEPGERASRLSSIAEVAKLVPELRAQLALPRETAPDGAEARFRFYEGISSFLRGAAQREPLVLVLDDLHWADSSSLRLLAFLARETRDSRLLVLGTYRSDERTHGELRDALARLAQLPEHERIVLTGLRRDDVARLVARSAGADPEPALVDVICERTDGNPFFVRELVRLLESEGALTRPGGEKAWRRALPLAVQDVISRRLERLSRRTRDLLGAAAVIGRDFPVDVLQRATGATADAVVAGLSEAERGREIRPHPDETGSFRFVHALIQDVLTEDLGAVRRASLHRSVAEALEAVAAERLDPPLAEIAHHWFEGAGAADAGRMAEAALRAARAALARLAYEAAAALCRRALAALDALEAAAPEARCDLLALLVRAEYWSGNGSEWRSALQRAVELARRIGAPQRLARVAIDVGDVGTGVVDWQAVALYEESLAAARGDEPLRAQLMSGLACALYWSPKDAARVRALADEALELARKQGDPELLAQVLNNRHLAVWGADTLDDRTRTSTELIALAQRHGLARALYQGHANHLLDALESGDGAAAERDLAAMGRLSGELRHPGWASPPGAALRALLDGRLDESESLARTRFELIQRAGFPNAAMFYAVQLAGVRREQGRLGELESGLRGLRSQFPEMATWAATLAYLYAEDGREAEARAELEALAAKGLHALPPDATWLTTVGLLAEVAAFLRDVPRAQELAALLAPYSGRAIVIGPALSVMSSVGRPLALALEASGELDRAEAAFAEGLALEERLGGRCLAARTRAQHAELLERRGRPEDADRAAALASAALSASEATGMAKVAARARAVVERLAGVIPLRARRQEK